MDTDHLAREADQDRGYGSSPCAICDLPVSRSSGSASAIRGDTSADTSLRGDSAEGCARMTFQAEVVTQTARDCGIGLSVSDPNRPKTRGKMPICPKSEIRCGSFRKKSLAFWTIGNRMGVRRSSGVAGRKPNGKSRFRMIFRRSGGVTGRKSENIASSSRKPGMGNEPRSLALLASLHHFGSWYVIVQSIDYRSCVSCSNTSCRLGGAIGGQPRRRALNYSPADLPENYVPASMRV